MIDPRKVREWMARPLRNSDRVKRLSAKELKHLVNGLTPKPTFTTKLRPYQLATFLLCVKYPGYLISFDMGLGKTLTSLSVVNWMRDAGMLSRVLVLVPTSSNIGDWEDETARHFPSLPFAGLHESLGTSARQEAVRGDASVVCMTYAGLQTLCCRVAPDARTEKNRRVIDKKRATKFFRRFGAIIVDESTFVANIHSVNFKLLKFSRKIVPRHYLLTGTPFGSDPAAMWAQMYIADGGLTLGQTLGMYRSAFCDVVDTYWSTEYHFTRSKAKLLRRMLKNRAIRYSAAEVLPDLPPLQRITRRLTADSETYAYYQRIVDDLTEAKGNFRLVENSYHRMRQIASGWLTYLDPAGDKKHIRFKSNPKLEALVADVKAMPEESKGLVFNEYTVSGDLLEERLRAEKIAFVRVWGKAPDKRERLRRFKTDPKVKVLLIQNAAGSFGLNLQVANYVFVFESPVDPLRRQQLEKRAHRGGQTRRVFMYDYITRKTIEVKIQNALARGKNLFHEIIDGTASLV